jgi:hypothetical protein
MHYYFSRALLLIAILYQPCFATARQNNSFYVDAAGKLKQTPFTKPESMSCMRYLDDLNQIIPVVDPDEHPKIANEISRVIIGDYGFAARAATNDETSAIITSIIYQRIARGLFSSDIFFYIFPKLFHNQHLLTEDQKNHFAIAIGVDLATAKILARSMGFNRNSDEELIEMIGGAYNSPGGPIFSTLSRLTPETRTCITQRVESLYPTLRALKPSYLNWKQ